MVVLEILKASGWELDRQSLHHVSDPHANAQLELRAGSGRNRREKAGPSENGQRLASVHRIGGRRALL